MRKRTKEKNKSQMFRLFGIFILVQIFLSIPVYGENNQEEKTEDRSVEDLYNLEEEDKNGFYIGARNEFCKKREYPCCFYGKRQNS